MIAGQQITPTLRLVRPLGQGAMGSVWIADHLAIGGQVAVKFMTEAAARDPELVARFRREASAAAQIKNPHIAQVFDHGVSADGSLYIVMELLEGEDLKHRVARLGPLPLREVASIVSQTAQALGRAHQLGIVHRDIKPENLFILDLDGEPFVKILDFGIAKLESPGGLGMTSTSSLLGTPFYMSPEQLLSSKHVDARADLWALGVVAYQALTAKLPFTGDTLGALAVAVSAGRFAPASELRPGIPPSVDAWLARALNSDAAARFGSAREMAAALQAAIESAASTSHSTAVWEPAQRVGEAAVRPLGATVAAGPGQGAQAGTGAHAGTLRGVARTGAWTGQRRRSALAAVAAVLATLGTVVGILVATRRGGSGVEQAAQQATPPEPGASSASASSASAADSSGAGHGAAIAPASASAPSEPQDAGARPDAGDTGVKGRISPRRPPATGDGEDDVGF